MSGYIGTQPVPQATQTRDSFTATSGQTSFATGGYTPNFLDVYLNGVKLASADYTATNGSDVVLASGAATGDILEVVAFTTFNSASSSIDDNGNATAITIDSSENVMVGTTDPLVADGTNGGIVLGGQRDLLHVSRVNQPPVKFSRANNDGDIAIFAKDGTSVGSIGNAGANSYIGTGDTGFLFGANVDAIIPTNQGATRDNAIDLGNTGNRFKDAYLSGGIYLGGVGSANKLDDYEEGTWTPTLGGTAVYNIQQGTYTKIGKIVTINFGIRPTSIGTGSTFKISGIPFPHASGYSSGLSIAFYDGVSTTTVGVTGEVYNSVIDLYPKTAAVSGVSNTTAFFQNNARFYASATYITDA